MSTLLDPRLGAHLPICGAWDTIEDFLRDRVDPIMDRANFDTELWVESYMSEPDPESGMYTLWYSSDDYLDITILFNRFDF